MRNILLAGFAALAIAVPSTTYAQAPSGQIRELLTDAASKAIVDRRVEVVKITLGLRPDQERLWPAVEEAIRSRATARHERLKKLAAVRNGQVDLSQVTPMDALLARSEGLAQRAAGLKKLADAWQPLYATLDDNQMARLRFLAAYVLREMANAVEARRMAAEEEYDEDDE
jgi:LTXXQ motif family protein